MAAPFDNEKVRQAISYAINRQQILDMVADGHGTAVGSSIYPKLAKYFLPELVNYYEYNPEKAKQLLAEAGYPNGFDMSIAVISSYQPHMDTAEVVVEQLRAIGVKRGGSSPWTRRRGPIRSIRTASSRQPSTVSPRRTRPRATCSPALSPRRQELRELQ